MALANGSALCVGVGRYNDRGLVPLPDAVTSAREVQKAIDRHVFPVTAASVDPSTNGDLFLILQKAVREARGGAFFLYYAGHALRRGADILLAARDSELEGTKGCVPLSDVRDILKREGITSGLVVLNVDQPTGSGRPQLTATSLAIIGSVRTCDAAAANGNLRAYADVLLAALQRPAKELEAFLAKGVLDAGGLHRYLAERAPSAASHASFSMPATPPRLRDLAPVAPPPASKMPAEPVATAAEQQPAPPAPAAAAPPEPAPPPPPAPPEPAPAVQPAPAVEPIAAPAPEPAPAAAPPVEAAPAAAEPAPAAPAPPEPAPPEPAPAEPAPAEAKAAEDAPEPAAASERPVQPAPAAAPAPLAPTDRAPPAKRGGSLTYALLAAVAIVAALVYALLRS